MRENNNKSWLIATGGVLAWVLMLSGALGIYNSTSPVSSILPDNISFIAQQNNTATNAWSTSVAYLAPLHPFYRLLFNAILNRPAVANPVTSCTVDGALITPVAPGVIEYKASVNPSHATIVCGLLEHGSKTLVAVAPLNFLAWRFDNLPVGSYDIVCLTRQGRRYLWASSCTDGTFDVLNSAPIPNPPSIPAPTNPIDLELYGDVQSAPSFVVWNQMIYSYKVTNQLGNAWASTLRVYPTWLTNISANGAVLSGGAYIWSVPALTPGGGVAFELQWLSNASSKPVVVAELCDYTDDIDSKPCNIVNMVLNNEDDEIQL